MKVGRLSDNQSSDESDNDNESNNDSISDNNNDSISENNSDNDSDNGSDNDSDNDSDDWSDIDSDSSNISCIMAESFVRIKNFPVQILVMEKFDTTLTELDKSGLNVEEWRSILFEICFGLAIRQKHLDFVHNDLHSDNIMFKDIEKEYKYYYYKDKNRYFKGSYI